MCKRGCLASWAPPQSKNAPKKNRNRKSAAEPAVGSLWFRPDYSGEELRQGNATAERRQVHQKKRKNKGSNEQGGNKKRKKKRTAVPRDVARNVARDAYRVNSLEIFGIALFVSIH